MRITLLVVSLWLVTSPLWGKIVFHSNRAGNVDIYTMESDGRNLTQLTFDKANDSSPVWSPNGRQIAFDSKRDGNAELYVMDTNGKNQRRLTHHPAEDWSPDWSPDGSQIVFESTRGDPQGDLNLFVMDADGSNVRQLTDVEFASGPKWSPDGKWILFEAYAKKTDLMREIYVIRPDGTGLRQISQPTGMQKIAADWSADGKQILYSETRTFNIGDVFPVVATVLNPGRQVVRSELTPIPLKAFQPVAFASDERSILFSGKKENHWNLYRLRLTDKKLIQLTNNVNPFKDADPHEWNLRLSVSRQQRLLAQTWGRIKAATMSK